MDSGGSGYLLMLKSYFVKNFANEAGNSYTSVISWYIYFLIFLLNGVENGLFNGCWRGGGVDYIVGDWSQKLGNRVYGCLKMFCC